jgi:hypothetical protein
MIGPIKKPIGSISTGSKLPGKTNLHTTIATIAIEANATNQALSLEVTALL